MKPSPKYDFPVSVRRQTWEEEPATAPFYEGIFDVELNYSMTLMFVPAFQREPWPPKEARSMVLAMSNYAVTPDDSRAGTEESFAREWSESDTWGPRRPAVPKRLLKLIPDSDLYRPYETPRRAASSGILFAFITPCG
jgi:hypothetical protein